MRRIEAIVRPYLVEAVKSALAEVGVVGMTISEVKGIGGQKGHANTASRPCDPAGGSAPIARAAWRQSRKNLR